MISLSALGDISTMVLAAATTVVAIATFRSVTQNKRQTKALIRQTLVLKSQQDPVLVIKSFNIHENTLNITIENIGNGPAQLLAVRSSYGVAKWRPSDSPPNQEEQAIMDFLNTKRRFFGNYQLELRELVYEGKKQTLDPGFGYLVNSDANISFLPRGETRTYTLEVKFMTQWGKKVSDIFGEGKGRSFEELKDMMKSNNVKFIGVSLDLMVKNMNETEIPTTRICKFVIDFERHKNLEEAYKEKQEPSFFVNMQNEVVSGKVWYPQEFYPYQTSQNSPESFDNKDF